MQVGGNFRKLVVSLLGFMVELSHGQRILHISTIHLLPSEALARLDLLAVTADLDVHVVNRLHQVGTPLVRKDHLVQLAEHGALLLLVTVVQHFHVVTAIKSIFHHLRYLMLHPDWLVLVNEVIQGIDLELLSNVLIG